MRGLAMRLVGKSRWGRSVALAFAPVLAVAPASALAAAQRRAPQPYVVRDVRLQVADDAPRVAIVLREGRIERVLDSTAPTPPGARVVDGKGMLATPAFIDAFTQAGCAAEEPKADRDLPTNTLADVDVDMRDANRKGVHAAFRAADVLELADESEAYRESGFGALLSAPRGQILAGTSTLAVTREAAARDAILAADVFAHAAFRASGSGYPSTLMGYTAQLRQFLLDARRHEMIQGRARVGRPAPRPPFDADLEAAMPILGRRQRVACEADGASDIDRWIALADEFGFEITIVGGREAWRRADVLAKRGIPVVLTLDWGEEIEDPDAKKDEPPKEAESPADAAPAEDASKPVEPEQPEKPDDAKRWVYEEPLAVRAERRRLWEEGRDCVKRLHDAGVLFAFGSAAASPGELVKKVRTLVETGLPSSVALEALTRGAAEVVAARSLGAIEPGLDATFALWTADPLAKDAKIAWLFVDGFAHEFDLEAQEHAHKKPDEGLDVSGTWELAVRGLGGEDVPPVTLELTMEPAGDVKGTLRTKDAQTQDDVSCNVSGHVGGKRMTLAGTLTTSGMEIRMHYDGEIAGDEYEGEVTVKGSFGEETARFDGRKKPKDEEPR